MEQVLGAKEDLAATMISEGEVDLLVLFVLRQILLLNRRHQRFPPREEDHWGVLLVEDCYREGARVQRLLRRGQRCWREPQREGGSSRRKLIRLCKSVFD